MSNNLNNKIVKTRARVMTSTNSTTSLSQQSYSLALPHDLCGVDFFISYNKCNPLLTDLINNLKAIFKK